MPSLTYLVFGASIIVGAFVFYEWKIRPRLIKEASIQFSRKSKRDSYTALVLGGTGATGRAIRKELIHSDSTKKIIVLVRSSTETPCHSKEHIVVVPDLLEHEWNKEEWDSQVGKIDAIFCALGTTLKKCNGSKSKFYRIDHDQTLGLLRSAAEMGGATHLSLVSSVGADPKSMFLYTRTKGQLENHVAFILELKTISIFRPSLLIADRNESRHAESIARFLSPFLNMFLVGPLEKYRSIHVRDVARAMILEYEGVEREKSNVESRYNIYPSNQIEIYANVAKQSRF